MFEFNRQGTTEYETRCSRFERLPDVALVESSSALLKEARITLVNRVLIDSIKLAQTKVAKSVEKAKQDINTQVRGFGQAKIIPLKDLHRCLWQNATRVIKDQPVT